MANLRGKHEYTNLTEDSLLQALVELKKRKKGLKLSIKPTHVIVHPSWFGNRKDLEKLSIT